MLAKQLQDESETEFLTEKMQPQWISSRIALFSYRIIAAFSVGLFILFGFWLIFIMIDTLLISQIPLDPKLVQLSPKFIENLQSVETESLIREAREQAVRDNRRFITIFQDIKGIIQPPYWIVVGNLMYEAARNTEIKAVEKLNWSWLSLGISFPLFFAVILISISNDLLDMDRCALVIAGLCLSVIVFFSTSTTKTTEKSVSANQGIWRSAVNAALVSAGTAFLVGTIIVIGSFLCIGGFEYSSLVGLVGFVLGIFSGLSIGWKFGGEAFFRHFLLRCFLYNSGSIPWDYVWFLDYATKRSLLQRVGGRYRFIHKLLQDHFAEMAE